jgi:hypothetical protein
VGLEEKIPARSDVALVGDFQPTGFKHNGFKTGVKPEHHSLNK